MQQQSQQSMQQNCSLELRKIPRGLNAISHLNNHFSKFGKIVNIQVSYDNDPEAAIVTFSSHAEANVAYRSTEAVLNNRFIKVFWHTPTGEPPKGPELPAPGSMSLRRTYTNPNAYPSASQAQGDSGTVTTTTTTSSVAGNSSTNPDSTTSITTTQAPTQPTQKSTTYISPATATAREQTKASNQLIMKQVRATNELIRKKQEEQTKTAVQLAHGLQEKKHELLQKYLKQMRSIVELAEKTESDAQRHQYMDTIKILQASIDKLRKEINEQVNIQSKINPHAKARKTKEQQQKELLDVELDLISKEQHGETDTAAIQKRLQELQKSLARAQSYFPTAPRPPRPVRVIAPPGSTSVDRRPTTILITGFLLEDSDAVLGHFKVSAIICWIFLRQYDFNQLSF
jgi:RNA-binding protein 26